MAKKSNSNSTPKDNRPTYDRVAGWLALISLFISGLVFAVSFTNSVILKVSDGNAGIVNLPGWINLIPSILMLIAVIMISWRALRKSSFGKTTWIIVVYWVIVVLAAVGVIGVGIFSFK